MMRIHRICGLLGVFAACCVQGAVIGQWSASDRSWNHPNFTSVYAAMVAAGNVIPADGAITPANLAAYDSLLIGEPGSVPTGGEFSLLLAWLQAGGQLLLLNDSSSSAGNANSILAGTGSTMTVGGSMDQNMYLTGTISAITGPPYDVSGLFLSGTPGVRVSGGTALTRGGAGWTLAQQAEAAAYIHYEPIGLGQIIVFGDRLDHDFFSFPAGSARLNFFTNVGAFLNVRQTAPGPGPDVPEPATLLLVTVGVGAVALLRRRAI